jgi:hypothetical protein
MHNMAWLRADQARRMAVSGATDPERVREVLLGAESTSHFDRMIGTASLLSFVPVLRAQVLTLLDRHANALELFDAHLATALAQGMARMQCGMLAEVAWCRVNVGDAVGARRDALAARDRIADCTQADESAATHGRLVQVFEALGDWPAAEPHRAQAAIDWQLHTDRQARLIALLASTPAIAG